MCVCVAGTLDQLVVINGWSNWVETDGEGGGRMILFAA